METFLQKDNFFPLRQQRALYFSWRICKCLLVITVPGTIYRMFSEINPRSLTNCGKETVSIFAVLLIRENVVRKGETLNLNYRREKEGGRECFLWNVWPANVSVEMSVGITYRQEQIRNTRNEELSQRMELCTHVRLR